MSTAEQPVGSNISISCDQDVFNSAKIVSNSSATPNTGLHLESSAILYSDNQLTYWGQQIYQI